MPGNGNPTTEMLLEYFSDLLNVTHTIVTDKEIFAKRGLVRNLQIENSDSDWIMFCDADNLYPKNFFSHLFGHINKYNGPPKCIYSKEKLHTEEDINKYLNITQGNMHVNDAYNKGNDIPMIKKSNKPVAAGCMQVVRKDWTGGYYVTAEECRDKHLFKRGQRAKSDVQFRKRIGGSHRIKCGLQIHLNHARDKNLGYHSEEQR